ncbi:MAG: ABC transporter substrate binding protein [Pseudomonadota bacterium]
MWRYLSLFLALICPVTSSIFADANTNPSRVMIVHSYERDHICGAPQADGVVAALREAGWVVGENLQILPYYMDTKKTHTTPEAIQEQARIALRLVDKFAPEVVVVLDDNAIREVMLPLVDRDDVSVVFSGMNGQPETYNEKIPFMHNKQQPGANVTGVYEKLWASKSLVVMNAALENINKSSRVVGITDYSPTGNAITRQFELEITNESSPISWQLRRVKDFTEYSELIKELNADGNVIAIYPAALSLKTADGTTYTAKEIFAWTTANSIKPEMALNYYFAKIGLFGGAAVDFGAMGHLAGKKVARILQGKKAGELPIEDAKDYAIVFNTSRAKELGITIPDALLTAADHVYKTGP